MKIVISLTSGNAAVLAGSTIECRMEEGFLKVRVQEGGRVMEYAYALSSVIAYTLG